MEAIILAGGLGKRLQHLLPQTPKPMAMVAGSPFLEYILQHLAALQFKRIILSVGYLAEQIQDHFQSSYLGVDIQYCYESVPLGTGGAISAALHHSSLEDAEIFILNGDSFLEFNPRIFTGNMIGKKADIILGLKKMTNPHRYGTVDLNSSNKIINFKEKRNIESGMINCGVYLIKRDLLNNYKLNKKYSFEKDFLEVYLNKLNAYGEIVNGYFIDIGVEEDFLQAQKDFAKRKPLIT